MKCSQTSAEIHFIYFFLQMTEVLKAGVLSDEIDLGALAHNAAEQAEEFVRKVSWWANEANEWYDVPTTVTLHWSYKLIIYIIIEI